MRPDLQSPSVSPAAYDKMQAFHAPVLDVVRDAVATHPIVVVGMLWNPHVRRARAALDRAGLSYHYLGYGSYLTGWKPRLAIKLWSGWPTYPQIFVDGQLLGGADQVAGALADGTLAATAT